MKCQVCFQEIPRNSSSCPECGDPKPFEIKPTERGQKNPPTQFHPWRRFFARTIDYDIYFLTIFIPIYLLTSSNFQLQLSYVVFVVIFILTILFCLLVEALMVSLFSTTIGKWAFGIFIADKDGNKLNFSQSLERSLLVLYRGLGLLVPIVSLVTMLIAFNKYKAEGETSWDLDMQTALKYSNMGAIRTIFCIILFITTSSFANVFGHVFFESKEDFSPTRTKSQKSWEQENCVPNPDVTWEEIVADERYQSLDMEDRMRVREKWESDYCR